MKKAIPLLCNLIFWGWNIGFLVWIYLLLLPLTGRELFTAAWTGAIPPSFGLSFLGLMIVPAVCIGVGWRFFRKRHGLLLRLFYGVEAPLLTLLIIRLFLLRELTPLTTVWLTTLALGMVTFGLELWVGYAATRKGLARFQLVSHSLVLLMGLYVGTLLLFYVIPLFCSLVYNLVTDWLPAFFSFGWLEGLWQEFWIYPWFALNWLVLFALFCFSCALFVALPFVFTALYLRSWNRIATAFRKQYGQPQTLGITLGTILIICLSFTLAVRQPQPQIQALALLAQPAQTQTERQALLQHQSQIRQGLTNAYLYPYRYLSPWENIDGLQNLYEQLLGIDRTLTQPLQTFHNWLISPFLYQGSRDDRQRAAQLYSQFFDVPIQQGEQGTLQQALNATANRDQAQAGLLNINQEVVWVTDQDVQIREQGDWAEVTIHERYENSTPLDEEIFYSFSLPESAVITGLWLGDDKDVQAYPFVVSPRGAAQQVYNQEVQRQIDPALLEQVGPRQYRLRVFPVPALVDWNQPGHAHVTFTYQVLQRDGTWPLPQLSQRRNVFWNGQTRRTRNGDPFGGDPRQATQDFGPDRWFEPAFPAQQPTPATAHTIALAPDYTVTAQPIETSDLNITPLDLTPLTRQNVAIVLDSSYSMAEHQAPLNRGLTWLNSQPDSQDWDAYLAVAPGVAPQRFDEIGPLLQQQNQGQIPFYGTLQLSQLLQQFADLRDDRPYDALLVLTDAGTYELSEEQPDLPDLDLPLWIVHLDQQFPPAYEDTVLQAIQVSNGGVETSIEAALQRLARQGPGPDPSKPGQGKTTVASIVDGYVWQVREPNLGEKGGNPNGGNSVSDAETSPAQLASQYSSPSISDDPFAPFATRQAILVRSRQRDLSQLAELDAIHSLAKQTQIVSPYSSMLVLINDAQREALAAAEEGDDRFVREVETGDENLSQPHNPLVVPETSSLLGLVVGGGGLLWLLRRQSRQRLQIKQARRLCDGD
jgi:putative PEP-CTERM system integral membrane protein